MKNQYFSRQVSLADLMVLVGVAAYSVSLFAVPFWLRVLGYITTIVAAHLSTSRIAAKTYMRCSLAAMSFAMVVFLTICYSRNEQPFSMNYIASDVTISIARKTIFSIGIFFGFLLTCTLGKHLQVRDQAAK